MWESVLDRWWLWNSCEPCITMGQKLAPAATKASSRGCDLVDYPGVLLWCRNILRRNPSIVSIYRTHLVETLKNTSNFALEYDALAVEWFLLGLVEIPPGGFDDEC